ncbi:response regulator [Symbiopectobacterium purcellii]|uniref:response regulator n=1 Tax=Symbiopectobacterium purcellii TaxID=2871826 RepID=UPI002076A958|nr:response regulator [Symbiopectobacterium purcellii]
MQVMFVDDESRVLSGIERALIMQNIEWECRFANSGQKALSMLEEQPADVVISDMRMPFMDGAELLSQIRTHWPGTIRVILSGYSDPDATERMLDVAHRFVSKPCESNVLIGMVKKHLVTARYASGSRCGQYHRSCESLANSLKRVCRNRSASRAF